MRHATRTLMTVGLLTVTAWSVGSTIAPAATAPETQAATDPKGDVRSPLDLTRVAVSRAADGRLRASLTSRQPGPAATC